MTAREKYASFLTRPPLTTNANGADEVLDGHLLGRSHRVLNKSVRRSVASQAQPGKSVIQQPARAVPLGKEMPCEDIVEGKTTLPFGMLAMI